MVEYWVPIPWMLHQLRSVVIDLVSFLWHRGMAMVIRVSMKIMVRVRMWTMILGVVGIYFLMD
jgi:hypothetical protein